MAAKVHTHELSEPLEGATSAKVNIDTGSGNLIIDELTGSQALLASGTLEYLEDQGLPGESLDRRGGEAVLALSAKSSKQPWLRLPWATCNGATEWRIHLNPAVLSELTAYSGGGNVRLDLTGTAATQVSADTGGGNVELALPNHAAGLRATARTGGGNVTIEVGAEMQGMGRVTAKSGAGNVVVRLPASVPALIHAASGLGKINVDPRFAQVDQHTYQSADYDSAADKLELTLDSGAGDVVVATK